MSEYDMYADEEDAVPDPQRPGPVALLFAKVDRLETELRSTKAQLAKLESDMRGSATTLQRLRSKFSGQSSLDNNQNNR
jgi:hypothetical protein